MTTFVVGYSAVLERPEICDVLALLHVVVQHDDAEHLMRLLATPRFQLSSSDLTRLAALADRENTRVRFRVLAEAGVADADCPPEQWESVVREHRDQVGNAVFLGDLLQRGDLRQLLDRDGTLGDSAKAGVLRAGAMLRDVQAMLGHPLAEVIRAHRGPDAVEHAGRPDRHLYPGTGGRADADAARFPLLGGRAGQYRG